VALVYDSCPHCGKTVIRGAMRCLGCGKILKTAEEQAVSIEKLRKSVKKNSWKGMIRVILLFSGMILLYFYFSEQLHILLDTLF